MIKKNYISIISFLVLFTIGFIYLNKVFKSTHYYNNTIEDFKNLSEKTNIDVVFYGSSHSYTAYNPIIINKQCKTISYNLGSDALRLPFTGLVLKESLKYTKPKLVVLEVYQASIKPPISKEIKGYQLRALDFVPNFTSNKLHKINGIYNKSEIPSVLFPVLRNHKKWSENGFLNLNRSEKINLNKKYFYCGYIGTTKTIVDNNIRIKYNSFQKKQVKIDSSKIEITQIDKENLKKFIDIAKSDNIKVLILSSPTINGRSSNYNFFIQLSEFCKKMNVKYLNLNNLHQQIGLDFNDYIDLEHLNVFGGTKNSTYISNYINKNYFLPDRSSEKIWKSSNENYIKFNRYYLEKKDEVFTKDLNFELIKNIKIKNIKIIRNNKRHFITLNFDTSKPLKNLLKNYKLGVHIIPENDDLENLDNDSKHLGRKFEIENVRLDNGFEIFPSFTFYTKIKNLKAIRLFLYDKNGYKGVLGKAISITDISFK